MNVKAGDLAIVVNARLPENIGRIVTVIQFVGQHEGAVGDDLWSIECTRRLRGICVTTGEVATHPTRGMALARDAHLRPVSGLPIEEDTNIEERVPA